MGGGEGGGGDRRGLVRRSVASGRLGGVDLYKKTKKKHVVPVRTKNNGPNSSPRAPYYLVLRVAFTRTSGCQRFLTRDPLFLGVVESNSSKGLI